MVSGSLIKPLYSSYMIISIHPPLCPTETRECELGDENQY